jgi:chromosome segregation ATPase
MNYTAEIERLRKQMQPIQKTNSLLLIERNLAKLKAEKAGLLEMLKLAQAADVEGGLTQPSANTNKLKQQVDELDVKITTARGELAKARETYGAEMADALRPTERQYAELLHSIIDVLDRAAAIGVEVANRAAMNGVTCDVPHVRNALLVSALTRDLRLAASGSVR